MSIDNKKSIEPSASDPIPVMTDYDRMCKESNNVPMMHNMLASFFTWILLAGFIVFPGTFTSLRRATSSTAEAGIAGQVVLAAIQNTPLLVIAAVCCFVGAYGMCRLWWAWKNNYEWLLNHIFLPGFLNSVIGLITTLINIYTAQGGMWSITAITTVTATGACTVVLFILYLVYTWLLNKVKKGDNECGSIAYDINTKNSEEKVEPDITDIN